MMADERQPPLGYRVHQAPYQDGTWRADASTTAESFTTRDEAIDACERHKATVNEDIAAVFDELSRQYLRERDEARSEVEAWKHVAEKQTEALREIGAKLQAAAARVADLEIELAEANWYCDEMAKELGR